jgi:hypothetical protein
MPFMLLVPPSMDALRSCAQPEKWQPGVAVCRYRSLEHLAREAGMRAIAGIR